MIVEQDGNTFRIKPQGAGSIHTAGSGERQLWSMLAAMGPMSPSDAEEWMNGFIPKERSKGEGDPNDS